MRPQLLQPTTGDAHEEVPPDAARHVLHCFAQ